MNADVPLWLLVVSIILTPLGTYLTTRANNKHALAMLQEQNQLERDREERQALADRQDTQQAALDAAEQAKHDAYEHALKVFRRAVVDDWTPLLNSVGNYESKQALVRDLSNELDDAVTRLAMCAPIEIVREASTMAEYAKGQYKHTIGTARLETDETGHLVELDVYYEVLQDKIRKEIGLAKE